MEFRKKVQIIYWKTEKKKNKNREEKQKEIKTANLNPMDQ